MPSPQKHHPILIIGAGVFGLTTALELSHRGYTNITILDRTLPPVPDGSSVDVSRIIRPDYADTFYAQLGLAALDNWTSNPEFAPFFHRSGLLCVQSRGSAYLEQSKHNLQTLGAGANIQTFLNGREATRRYPGIHGDLDATTGYCNLNAGWADAEGSIGYLVKRCAQAGISFITGQHGTVTSLVTSSSSSPDTGEKGKRTIQAVRTAAGTTLSATTIILATGAWTPYLLDMSGRSISTGQPIAFIQLTPDEADAMQGERTPVMIDLSTGWFAFPPTPSNILKIARHGYGYEVPRTSPIPSSSSSSSPQPENNPSSPTPETNNTFSAPSLSPPSSNSSRGTTLPKDAEQALRSGLSLFLPRFKDRPFAQQRLCWYTDTPSGDFIVDYHPEYEGLFLATGGSGHAFKFLPILGSRIADTFEGIASAAQRRKWAWPAARADISRGDGSRGGPARRVLGAEERARL